MGSSPGTESATTNADSPASALKRGEKATLSYSYVGEFGRGLFVALRPEFALLVAVSIFGIKNRWILWFVSSACFVGYLFAPVITPLVKRWRKKSVVCGLEVTACILAMAAALVDNGMLYCLLVGSAIITNSISMPLVSSIYGINFSTGVRGRAVGRLQALRMGTAAVTAALLGICMQGKSTHYVPLLLIVAAASMLSAIYVWKLPETRRMQMTGRKIEMRRHTKALLKDGAFLYLELCWFVLGLSNLWVTPLRVLYLNDLGFSNQEIMLVTTTTMSVAIVFTTGIWGHLLYRMNFAVYRGIATAFLLCGVLVFFSAERPLTVAAGAALWGTGLAGGGLSWRLVYTFFCDSEHGPIYMSFHSFFCGIRGIIGPMLSLLLYGTIPVATFRWITVAGFTLSIIMLFPLVPVLSRRRKQMANETA